MKEKLQKNIMTLADFRTGLADTLCRYQSHSKTKREIPTKVPTVDKTLQYLTCVAIVLVMKKYLWILEISVNLIIVGNLPPGSVKSVKCRYAIIKKINVSHYFMHRYILSHKTLMPEISKLIPVFFF